VRAILGVTFARRFSRRKRAAAELWGKQCEPRPADGDAADAESATANIPSPQSADAGLQVARSHRARGRVVRHLGRRPGSSARRGSTVPAASPRQRACQVVTPRKPRALAGTHSNRQTPQGWRARQVHAPSLTGRTAPPRHPTRNGVKATRVPQTAAAAPPSILPGARPPRLALYNQRDSLLLALTWPPYPLANLAVRSSRSRQNSTQISESTLLSPRSIALCFGPVQLQLG
jgi:hypothetical protein